MLETFPYGKVKEFKDFLLLPVCGSVNKLGIGNWQVQTLATRKDDINWVNNFVITKKQGDETTLGILKDSWVAIIRGYKDYFLNEKNHKKHPFYITYSDTFGKFWTKPTKMKSTNCCSVISSLDQNLKNFNIY